MGSSTWQVVYSFSCDVTHSKKLVTYLRWDSALCYRIVVTKKGSCFLLGLAAYS